MQFLLFLELCVIMQFYFCAYLVDLINGNLTNLLKKKKNKTLNKVAIILKKSFFTKKFFIK